MSTTNDIEPSTIAAAWASSPLGEPMCESIELSYRGTEQTAPTSIARHAVVIAALACGIGLGAAFGLTVSDSTNTSQPVVMAPQVEAPPGAPTGPAQTLPEHNPALPPQHQAPPKPISTAAESAPVVEGAPATAEPSSSDVGSPTAGGPNHPDFVPPSSGDPANTTVTADIDVPQIPQPEPANPQKPGPTIELAPASDLPVLKPQLPPKVALLPPKSRFTVNEAGQKPPKSTRGLPKRNTLAKTGTAGDE